MPKQISMNISFVENIQLYNFNYFLANRLYLHKTQLESANRRRKLRNRSIKKVREYLKDQNRNLNMTGEELSLVPTTGALTVTLFPKKFQWTGL